MNSSSPSPFYVKDCTLAQIATGLKAQTLHELKEKIMTLPPGCFYLHFWGGRLRPSFEHHRYLNDFAYWVSDALHDDVLTERLAIVNPIEHESIEDLKAELVEIIENRLDEKESIGWIKASYPFYFVRAKIVIFQTQYIVNNPNDFASIIPHLTNSSLFYHFIDSAIRSGKKVNDFCLWLENYGDEFKDIMTKLRGIDPYLLSLTDIKVMLANIFTEHKEKI